MVNDMTEVSLDLYYEIVVESIDDVVSSQRRQTAANSRFRQYA